MGMNVDFGIELMVDLKRQMAEYYSTLIVAFPQYFHKWWHSKANAVDRHEMVNLHSLGFHVPPNFAISGVILMMESDGYQMHPDADEIRDSFYGVMDELSKAGFEWLDIESACLDFNENLAFARRRFLLTICTEYDRLVKAEMGGATCAD